MNRSEREATEDAEAEAEFELREKAQRIAREETAKAAQRFVWLIGIPSVVVLGAGWWVFSSAMEARAFNRATGADVSTWDALWIELRVQEKAK